VRIIALSTLKAFWEASPTRADAREPLLAWYRHVVKADWASPAAVKADFRGASLLEDGRVVLNNAGNKRPGWRIRWQQRTGCVDRSPAKVPHWCC
jgi:mRNA interferase HigB